MSVKNMSTRGRIVAGAVAVAVAGMVTVGAVSASADQPETPAVAAAAKANASDKNVNTVPVLTIEAATKAAEATLSAAEKAGQHVTVAVVDRDGVTRVLLKGDGAGPQSPESATRKAFTAVSWNATTSDLAKRAVQAPGLKDIPNTLFLAGGAPVQSKGAPIAGIGVAGAPSGDQDEQFAQAGVAAIGG
ncbi:heme-binding protein [Kitasatospora sp. NPDC006697]|uniref:GlcG/HbpS family heme-binding protein n=1 Tax=Kitasatospora sp. NPDC006697 TaxID=3364020 RepID=UPI0036CD421F